MGGTVIATCAGWSRKIIGIFTCGIFVLLHIQPKVFSLGVRQFGNISHVAVSFFLAIFNQPIFQNRSDLAHSGPGNVFFICPRQVIVQSFEKSLSLCQPRELAEIVVAARPVPASGFLVQTAYNCILGHALAPQDKSILPIFINQSVLHYVSSSSSASSSTAEDGCCQSQYQNRCSAFSVSPWHSSMKSCPV